MYIYEAVNVLPNQKIHVHCNYTENKIHPTMQLVIMGVANCHGYHLLQLLHDTDHELSVDITAIEENFIYFKQLTIVQKLQNKLKSQGINLAYVNFNYMANIKMDYNIIIYTRVYTILYNYMESLRTDFTEKMATTLKNFVSILEVIQAGATCSNVTVILPLIELSSPIQQVWLKQFEVTLVTYQTLYGLNAALLHINTQSGSRYKLEREFEDCRPIEHHIIQLASTNSNHGQLLKFVPCIEPEASVGISEWCSDYDNALSTPLAIGKDVIFTSYFVTRYDPQRDYYITPNRFCYIKTWFIGAMKNNLNIVIFYDKLDASWIRRAEEKYPRAKFVHGDLKGRSTNDARYYILHDYLVKNPDIKRLFITDGNDVQLWRSPFDLMDKLGNDMLYIGQDTPFYYKSADDENWMKGVLSRCYGRKIYTSEHTAVQNRWTLYNAGVLGGNRDMMLLVLSQIHKWLDKANKGENCNMGTVNIVAHKYFFDDIFVGYPLQSGFKIEIAGPFGQAVKHK